MDNREYGPYAGITKDSLCGAPIVDDDDAGDGAVAGFFQLANAKVCFSPIHDEIIYLGWDLQPQGK